MELIRFTSLDRQYATIRDEILEATDSVLKSGSLMNGEHTQKFEQWLAEKNNVKYAATLHSGTSALECIAEYYAAKFTLHSPKVLIPSMTYAATANAFIRARWNIHFVDVNAYGILDVNQIPDIDYDAIVLVGLYGASITDLIDDVCNFDNMIIIEDAAQHWLSSNCTRIGNAAAISFDPMKNLPAYGNGGALVTNDRKLYDFALMWRDNCKPDHDIATTNSRMSEVDCAGMMVKTKHLDAWQHRRESISRYWSKKLNNAGIQSAIDDYNIDSHCFHKFVIYTDNQKELQTQLRNRLIETKIHYPNALCSIGMFRGSPRPGAHSISSMLSKSVLSLPLYPELTDMEVDYIIDQVVGLYK